MVKNQTKPEEVESLRPMILLLRYNTHSPDRNSVPRRSICTVARIINRTVYFVRQTIEQYHVSTSRDAADRTLKQQW